MTLYYIASLRDYPELVLCHSNTPGNVHEFNDPTIAKAVRFQRQSHARAAVVTGFPGLPDELFKYTPQVDHKYELMYILPKSDGSVKYVLQNDDSLVRCGDSTDSRKFDSYESAYQHMRELDILRDRFVIVTTTEEF
jgi:hypothetical protein